MDEELQECPRCGEPCFSPFKGRCSECGYDELDPYEQNEDN